MLVALHNGQPTAETVDEFIHCGSVGQVVTARIEEDGVCIPNGDGMFFGVLKVAPGEVFPKVGGNLLLGLKTLPVHPSPEYHIANEFLHVQYRGNKQSLFQRLSHKGLHGKP